jgi:Kef-type K+ transport system membrane component KefB
VPAAEIQLAVRVLAALALIVLATRLTGRVFRLIGEPAVIGEIAAGILLGPSFFGALAPAASAAVLPPAVIPPIERIASMGVVLFMFTVGVHLDLPAVKRGARAAIVISQASIALPFVMGVALAIGLHASWAAPGVSTTAFALFAGVAMSVTAFPVLARIIADFGLQRAPVGAIALSAAAVDDVIAWCLLATVAGLARAEAGAALATVVLAAAFAVAMLVVVRPAVMRLARLPPSPAILVLLVLGALGSAAATDAIGIHALFGAFLFGAFVPSHSPAAEAITARLRGPVSLLLPAFFAITGVRTEVRLIDGASAWLVCLAIFLIACGGKMGGGYLAARWTGLPAREARAIAVLMNTRGLVELVVLNVGLSLGVITPALFTMFVLMALVTTAMTAPLLRWMGWRRAATGA